jgi:hypothetical protein
LAAECPVLSRATRQEQSGDSSSGNRRYGGFSTVPASARHVRIASARCELGRLMNPSRLHCLDGNRDGNVGSQCQPWAAADSQTLQRDRAELGIRYN